MTDIISGRLTLRETDEFDRIRALAVSSGLEDGLFEHVAEAYGIYDGSELVGCAALKIEGPRHSVEWLAVRDGLRLKGLGTRLVREVESSAKRRGAKRLWAVARAPAFFRHIGYSEASDDDLERPPMASCRACRQFGKTCHPEMMVKDLQQN